MDDDTMHADFNSVFNYDRRPKQGVAFVVQPGRRNMPRDLVEAAIAAGKAVEIEPPSKPPAAKPKRTTKHTEQTAAESGLSFDTKGMAA